jgi:hypothetical protein
VYGECAKAVDGRWSTGRGINWVVGESHSGDIDVRGCGVVAGEESLLRVSQ